MICSVHIDYSTKSLRILLDFHAATMLLYMDWQATNFETFQNSDTYSFAVDLDIFSIFRIKSQQNIINCSRILKQMNNYTRSVFL